MKDKVINLSDAGKRLEDYEDPLVCKLCGKNKFTVLDREEAEIFCHYCKGKRQWLDKSQIPDTDYVVGIHTSIDGKPSLKQIYKNWTEGHELTEHELEVFQEVLWSSIYFQNTSKEKEIRQMLDDMGVEVRDSR